MAICAERDVEYPFTDAARFGARVVFHPAAPGLYDKCTDNAGWKRGFDWWRDSSLELLPPHARKNGVYIAVATQAGATHDEDFPGWAVLIGPDGQLVDELPDWREGTLAVELPSSSPPTSER